MSKYMDGVAISCRQLQEKAEAEVEVEVEAEAEAEAEVEAEVEVDVVARCDNCSAEAEQRELVGNG
jgi:SH3-like domain-containing protein